MQSVEESRVRRMRSSGDGTRIPPGFDLVDESPSRPENQRAISETVRYISRIAPRDARSSWPARRVLPGMSRGFKREREREREKERETEKERVGISKRQDDATTEHLHRIYIGTEACSSTGSRSLDPLNYARRVPIERRVFGTSQVCATPQTPACIRLGATSRSTKSHKSTTSLRCIPQKSESPRDQAATSLHVFLPEPRFFIGLPPPSSRQAEETEAAADEDCV